MEQAVRAVSGALSHLAAGCWLLGSRPIRLVEATGELVLLLTTGKSDR